MAVSDREYLEMIANNIERRNVEIMSFFKEQIVEIKDVQKTTCMRVSELEKSDAGNKAKNGFIMGLIGFLGTIIAGLIQLFRG